jgi:hypothetical protein
MRPGAAPRQWFVPSLQLSLARVPAHGFREHSRIRGSTERSPPANSHVSINRVPGRSGRTCWPWKFRRSGCVGLDTEKEKGSDAALLCLPVFDAQSTLLQCSAVIGVTALLALLGRFLPKLRAALLRPFFLSRERIHGLMIGQANSTASTYIKSLSAVSRDARSLGWCILPRGKAGPLFTGADPIPHDALDSRSATMFRLYSR